MRLFATMLLVLLVLMTLPCSADETAISNEVAKRVYEEGLSRGIFTVPYTDDFVSHEMGSDLRSSFSAETKSEAVTPIGRE